MTRAMAMMAKVDHFGSWRYIGGTSPFFPTAIRAAET
jgi:hypothetical protein